MTRREYERMTKAQLRGRRARLTRDVQNGRGRIPAGAVVTIMGKLGGLAIESEKCSHCGIQIFATHVSPDALELVPIS